MRFKRLRSSAASRRTCAASGLERGIESCTLDCGAQLLAIGEARVEFDARASFRERHVNLAHAFDILQHAGDGCDASHAGHAGDFQANRFQDALLCTSSKSINLRQAFVVRAGCQRRKSSELLTTDTELSAIAAPATIGLRNPSAASGMPSTL